MRGFSLLEFIIAAAIVVIIAGVSFLSLTGIKNRNNLDLAVNATIAYLRDAQQRSLSQDQGSRWGIHFAGIANGLDWYEIFSGEDYASGVKYTRVALPSNLKFLDPAENFSKDIIFSKISGFPNASTSIKISFSEDENVFGIVNVNSAGIISRTKSL